MQTLCTKIQQLPLPSMPRKDCCWKTEKWSKRFITMVTSIQGGLADKPFHKYKSFSVQQSCWQFSWQLLLLLLKINNKMNKVNPVNHDNGNIYYHYTQVSEIFPTEASSNTAMNTCSLQTRQTVLERWENVQEKQYGWFFHLQMVSHIKDHFTVNW